MTTRTRIPVDDVLEQLRSAERDLLEVRVTSRTLRVEPGALVLQDGTRLELMRDGTRRFCSYTGAPTGYVLGLGQAVRARLLQHEIERGNLGETVMTVARGSELVGFTDPTLLTLRASELFQAATEALPADAGAYVDRLHVDDDRVQIDVLGDATTEEMAAGDFVAAGVRLTHSPLASSATRIESFLLRLLCENGLTHCECVSKRAPRTRRLPADHDGARELQLEQVRRLIRNSWDTLRAKLAVLRETQHEKLTVRTFLEGWVQRGGLSQRLHLPRLVRAWQLDGGGNTTYAAINALTRVSTHDLDLTAHQRRVLSGLAGILAFRRAHVCPKCFTALREPLAESEPGGAA